MQLRGLAAFLRSESSREGVDIKGGKLYLLDVSDTIGISWTSREPIIRCKSDVGRVESRPVPQIFASVEQLVVSPPSHGGGCGFEARPRYILTKQAPIVYWLASEFFTLRDRVRFPVGVPNWLSLGD